MLVFVQKISLRNNNFSIYVYAFIDQLALVLKFLGDISQTTIFILLDIGIIVRVFANGQGDLGSISGRVIPKTQKMVLDASLLNTQRYKVRIKGKVEQSRERSSALFYILV